MNLGERIKQERKRLELSQTACAALGNASKGSQISWEKGLASPNATVLSAWAAAGFDVVFLLTGEPTEKKLADMQLERDGWREVVRKFQFFLQLHKYDADLYEAFLFACEDVKTKWRADGGSNKSFDPIEKILGKSPCLLMKESKLEDLIERLEFTLSVEKIELSPSAKAFAIMQLYEATKKGDGRISLDMIQQATKK
jgi:transcriptional regulator with XRE-family HTH domain